MFSDCLRVRHSGPLASLAALGRVRIARHPAAGWTRRLRALAGDTERPSIVCLSSAARALAIVGGLTVGGLARSTGDRRLLTASLAYAALSAAILVLAGSRRAASERIGRLSLAVDLVAAAICAGVPGLELVALPAFAGLVLAASLQWGSVSMALSAAAVAVASTFGAGTGTLHAATVPIALMLTLTPALAWAGSRERRHRAEAAAADRLIAHARSERGFTGSLQAVLDDLLHLFGADQARLVCRDESSDRSFVWELGAAPPMTGTLHGREITGQAHAWETSGAGAPLRIPFQAEDWSGVLLLVGTAPGHDSARAARFLASVAHELIPALVSLHALARLRSRIELRERARLERELHDGVIQSLIAAEIRIAAVGRATRRGGAEAWRDERSRVQQILHEEVLGLRDFMRQLKPLDVDPEKLPTVLADLVDRFVRDTGIQACFSQGGGRASLNRRACAEVVRIVQEALTNVRKHSGARHVHVRLTSGAHETGLLVEDDGRGFPGRIASDGRHWRVPAVLGDSVRGLGGQLTIDTAPGQGARLRITIPADSQATASRFDRWMAS